MLRIQTSFRIPADDRHVGLPVRSENQRVHVARFRTDGGRNQHRSTSSSQAMVHPARRRVVRGHEPVAPVIVSVKRRRRCPARGCWESGLRLRVVLQDIRVPDGTGCLARQEGLGGGSTRQRRQAGDVEEQVQAVLRRRYRVGFVDEEGLRQVQATSPRKVTGSVVATR